MNFNIMDCILPVTWGVGVATIIWLFRKGNVENAAKSVAADRLIPTPEQTFSLMKCRRSISPKDYVPGGNVSTQDLNRMLEAANWAPTHGKTQPWHYVILSGTRAIQRYLDFISDWYIMRADTIAEGKLSSVRRKYEKLSEFWPRGPHNYEEAGAARQADARVGGDVRNRVQCPELAPDGNEHGHWRLLVLSNLV